MNKKWLPYLLILGMAIALFVVRRWNSAPGKTASSTGAGPANSGTPTSPGSRKQTGATGNSRNNSTSDQVNRDRGFDRRTDFIEYTKHARCRMECREITGQEVKGIMEEGKINYSKSDVKAKPCPEYALEGNTSDGQRVRIVFAQCDQKTKVVTVIDLGKDWSCDCPGDDKKSRR